MKKVDLSNTIRPFALLEIANWLKQLQPGKAMEIVGLDAGGIHDLKYILPDQAHGIQISIFSENHGRMRVQIRRSTATDEV